MVVIAALGSQDLWYVSRGSGLVLLVALSLDVALGVAVRKGARAPGLPRFATERLHRDLALLAGSLAVLHVVTAILDPYAAIGWLAALVPLASPYRPLWIGLGALSLDLVLATLATSLLRRHVPRGAWWAVHALVYLAWPLALVHALRAGGDLRIGLVAAVIWGCVALVVAALAWRLAGPPAAPAGPQPQRAARRLGTGGRR